MLNIPRKHFVGDAQNSHTQRSGQALGYLDQRLYGAIRAVSRNCVFHAHHVHLRHLGSREQEQLKRVGHLGVRNSRLTQVITCKRHTKSFASNAALHAMQLTLTIRKAGSHGPTGYCHRVISEINYSTPDYLGIFLVSPGYLGLSFYWHRVISECIYCHRAISEYIFTGTGLSRNKNQYHRANPD